MPANSRNARGKHLHNSKKSKARQRQATLATRPATAATPAGDAGPGNITPLRPAIVTSKPRTMDYPYITGELRRIGVLAGLIFIILIILAITIH